jgi:hypothetical protein
MGHSIEWVRQGNAEPVERVECPPAPLADCVKHAKSIHPAIVRKHQPAPPDGFRVIDETGTVVYRWGSGGRL